MRFNEGPYQRQSETGASRVASECRIRTHQFKRTPEPRHLFLAHAAARVAHAEHGIRTFAMHLQSDCAARRREFHSIGEEVREDLPQRPRIGAHQVKIAGWAQRYAGILCVGFHEPDAFRRQLRWIQYLGRNSSLPDSIFATSRMFATIPSSRPPASAIALAYSP